MEKVKNLRENELNLMSANLKPMTAIQASSILAKSIRLVPKTPSILIVYGNSDLCRTITPVLKEMSFSYILAGGEGENQREPHGL